MIIGCFHFERMMSGQITHGRSTLTLYIKNADTCMREELTSEMCNIKELPTSTKRKDGLQSSAYVTDIVSRICGTSDHRNQNSGLTPRGRDCDKLTVKPRGTHGMLQRQSIIHDSNQSLKVGSNVSSVAVNADNDDMSYGADLAAVCDNAETGDEIDGYPSSNTRHQMTPSSKVACRASGVGVSPSKENNKGVSVSDSPVDARCTRAFSVRQARLFLRKRDVCMKRGRLFRSPTDPRTRIVDDSLDLALQLPTLRRQSLPANYVIKSGRRQSVDGGEWGEETGAEAGAPRRRRRKRSNSIPVLRTRGSATQTTRGGYEDSESSSCNNSEFITFQCQCQSLYFQPDDGECFVSEHSTYPPFTTALQASLDSSFEHNRDRLCLAGCATSHTSASSVRHCDSVGDGNRPLFSCVIEPAVSASAGQGISDPCPSCHCGLCRSVFLSEDDCESDNVFMTAGHSTDRNDTADSLFPHPQVEGHEPTSPTSHSAYRTIPVTRELSGASATHQRHRQHLCVRRRRDSSESDTTSPPSSVHSVYSLSSSPVSSQMSRATSPTLSPLPARRRSNTLPSHFPNPAAAAGGRSRPLSLLPRDPIQPHKGDLHKLIKQRSIGENSGESDNEEEDEFFSIPTHTRRSHTWSETRAWRSRKRYVRNRPATPPPGPVLTTSGGDVFDFTDKRKVIHSSREKLGIPSRDLELVPESSMDSSEGGKGSTTHHRSLAKTRSLSPICNYALFPNNNTSPQERPSLHASHNGGHIGHRMRRSRSPSPSNFSRLERILEPTSVKASQEDNNEKDDVERTNIQTSTSCGEECKIRSQTDALLKLAIRDEANACKS